MITLQPYRQKVINSLNKHGVLNTRIIDKIQLLKNDSAVQKYQKKILKEKKQILTIYKAALNKGIAIGYDSDVLIKNLDKFDSKDLTKEINDLLYFKKRKAECIRRLSAKDVPIQFIQLLTQTKNIKNINSVLDKLPPKLLVEAGLLKTKYGDCHLTKNSIKFISTPMKD